MDINRVRIDHLAAPRKPFRAGNSKDARSVEEKPYMIYLVVYGQTIFLWYPVSVARECGWTKPARALNIISLMQLKFRQVDSEIIITGPTVK